MEKIRKKYLKSAVIIPIIVAIIVAVSAFVFIKIVFSNAPVLQDEYKLSDYVPQDIETLEFATSNEAEIEFSSIQALSDNVVFGRAKLGGASYDIIYNANELNASGKLNMPKESRLIGERGTAFLCCNKSAGEPIFKLQQGDTVSIETHYDSYEYRVLSVLEHGSADQLEKCANDLSGGLVIYTDGNTGYGISDTYYALVCEKISGADITE